MIPAKTEPSLWDKNDGGRSAENESTKSLAIQAKTGPATDLSLLRGYSHHFTTRYQAVFTDVSAVKARYVWLGTNTYPPHLPLIWRINMKGEYLETLRASLSASHAGNTGSIPVARSIAPQ